MLALSPALQAERRLKRNGYSRKKHPRKKKRTIEGREEGKAGEGHTRIPLLEGFKSKGNELSNLQGFFGGG